MSLTPEQIAAIATQAALAAVAAVTGGTVAASPAEPEKPEPVYDEEADERGALETIRENEAHAREIEPLAAELIPKLMQERHLIVFRWLAFARGVSQSELLRQIVRAEVARETPNWREAQGMGGKSTKSAQTMAALRGE